ncbi:hypothetical protein AMTR_s00043p00232690 [Amborella trichopoda]|uniref:CMP/dCMP-type deaminase domain-containing protein n=1 Tax=Amborella trichopoda TaxID=13333 RepID=W1PZ31_AMBTC|nr:hypothetical protein AMTR_s00043p00232690 [Amborella trichopoda]
MALSCGALALALGGTPFSGHALDATHMQRAAGIADKSAGCTSPHPNFGCVIARGERVVGEGFLYAQGTKCAELQAVEMSGGELCKGATAYLNLEHGDCHGDDSALSALIQVSSITSFSLT